MILLKDLGAIRKPKDMNRYGEYECPVCEKPFITRVASVKNKSSTKCKKCSCNKDIHPIEDVIAYNEDSGKFSWKIRTSNRINIGDECNNKNIQGYIVIVVNKKTYLAHRLAWFFKYGDIADNMEIDHINRIKDDNRISNLRLVTSSENSRNLPKTKRNNSGTVGVSWYKNRNKWRATIMNEGKQIHLGYYDNKDDAIRIRKSYEKEYKYHINHGIESEDGFGSTGE